MEKSKNLLETQKQTLEIKDSDLELSVKNLYEGSKQQIFEVVDAMIMGIIKDSDELKFSLNTYEPKLPEKEVWDFHLGDTVTVKLTREDFEWMQRKTVGWDERQNQVYGHAGIITKVYCEFDGQIEVCFPEINSSCFLYASVLKKVEPSKLHSRWKVGDFVKTVSSMKVQELFHEELDVLPNKIIGKKGRVVAVTNSCILVTFDEKQAYTIRPASLLQCKDKSPIISKEVKHARGFKVGEKVKVISNLKKLIENQQEHGGWIPAMSSVVGKIVTIVCVYERGTVVVRVTHYRNWRLNPDSVLHLTETEIEEKDLKFHLHNNVKVTLPRKARLKLLGKKVPRAFFEYLQGVAILLGVDKDFKYYIQFNTCWNIGTVEKLLRKATVAEKQKYKNIEKKVKELKVGDKVHLDVGPPNFVKAIIPKLDLDPTVAMAMMNSATLIGFTNPCTAVIQYKNGQRFQVKRRYLTVPDKFLVNEYKDVKFDIDRIRDAIMQSLKEIHGKANAPRQDYRLLNTVVFESHGVSPYVEYEIKSTVATFDAVLEQLDQNSGWSIELLGVEHFLLHNTERSIQEVEVRLIFNHDTGPIMEGNDFKYSEFLEPKPAGDVGSKCFVTEIDQLHFWDESQPTDNLSSQKFEEQQKFPYDVEDFAETSKNIEPEKNGKIHFYDKSQQTDFPSPKSEEEKQYAYNMGCPVKTTKVIGPKGGFIQLFRYKVVYPPKSLKEEKEIELSIDNNPCNFPEEGLPITSILNIKPSMELEVPAIVTMPTTCRATSGEVTIQIWNKEKGQDWEKSQTVALKDKNEIIFEVGHFCGKTATTLDEKGDNLEFNVQNRLFIQKDTGIILSVFWQENWFIQETITRCTDLKYKDIHPTNEVVTGVLNAEFEVKIICVSPDSFQYSPDTGKNSASFKITAEFINSKTPRSIMFVPSVTKIPESVEQIRIKYLVSTHEPILRIANWPIKDVDSSSTKPDIQVIYNKDIVGFKAESGGAIQAGTSNIKTSLSG